MGLRSRTSQCWVFSISCSHTPHCPPGFRSPASRRPSKGRVTLPHPLFGERASASAPPPPSRCVFPPPGFQSSPSEPERHRCLSSHAASTVSVNRRCLDGSRLSSPSSVLSGRVTAVDRRPLCARGVSWWAFSVWTQQWCFDVPDLLLSSNHCQRHVYLCFFWVRVGL